VFVAQYAILKHHFSVVLTRCLFMELRTPNNCRY